VDPLADVMDVSRVSGAMLANVRAHAPWGLALPQSSGASFHALTSGTAWLRVDGAEPLQLMPGDVLLLPRGIPHRLSATPDGRCRPFDRTVKEQLMTSEGDLVLDGTGAVTTFVCAGYDYDHDVAHSLLSALPAVLHMPADPVAGLPVTTLVSLLAGELGVRRAGARAAVARLIDLLLIHVVRAWSADAEPPSWLRALHDPVVGRALAELHARPGEPWTITSLATEVHLSRATLARRFTELVGEPPLAYLTRWRMDLAARRLKDTTDPVQSIARDVGYTSEYAFNRAFSRHRGLPPGRYRRAAATTQAPEPPGSRRDPRR
jgi:AraC-like DNA-binding protein